MAVNPLVAVRLKGRSYATARRRYLEALEELRLAIVQADEEGAVRAQIVQESGLARQTVYAALNRER